MDMDEMLEEANRFNIDHDVFDRIEKFNEVYNSLSDSCFSYVSLGTVQIFNYDSYIYSTMESTLRALSLLLKNGYINDAFTLLRKYMDLTIINVYFQVKIDKEHSLENFIIKEIDGWIKGKNTLDNITNLRTYISKNFQHPQIEDFFDDKRLKSIRDITNDFTHYNSYRKLIANDPRLYNKNRKKYYDEINSSLEIVFVRHFAFQSLLRSYYFRSSDYIDHLDMGLIPPEGSENWVMNTISNTFEWIRDNYSLKLYEYLRDNNPMDI